MVPFIVKIHEVNVVFLSIALVTIGMLIPVLLIVLSSALIIIVMVYRKYFSTNLISRQFSKKDKNVLIQLAMIVMTFLVGYTGDYAAKLYVPLNIRDFNGNALLLASHGVLRVTECLNPFLYYFASGNIHTETKRLLKTFRNGLKFRSSPNNVVAPVSYGVGNYLAR